MRVTGRARLAGVIGWPVAHSRSPLLHGHWLERHGIDGAYLPLPVKPGRVAPVLRMLAELGFRGVNVTLPHKEEALAACDELDASAEGIGAVNTVVMAEGRLRGSNSDGYGFLENLKHGHPGWQARGARAAVIGAGGAARAIVFALAEAGAAEIRIINRTQSRAEQLAAGLGDILRTAGRKTAIDVVSWDVRQEALSGAGLLVNASSLGMDGKPPLALDLNLLPSDALVTDIVYAPLETDLLARAKARGNAVVDGLGMLLHQARPGFAAWFGVEPVVDGALRRAVLAD